MPDDKKLESKKGKAKVEDAVCRPKTVLEVANAWHWGIFAAKKFRSRALTRAYVYGFTQDAYQTATTRNGAKSQRALHKKQPRRL